MAQPSEQHQVGHLDHLRKTGQTMAGPPTSFPKTTSAIGRTETRDQ